MPNRKGQADVAATTSSETVCGQHPVSIQTFSPRRLSALNPACRYGFSQSTDNPARRLGEEVFKHRQLGLRFGATEDVGFGFFKRDAAVVDGFIHIFDGGDLLGGEAVATHAFAVDACGFGAVACRHEIRRYVFVYACGEGGHGVIADLAELEHQRVAAQDDVVADGNVSGEGGVVGEDGVVADDAVVREVAVRRNPVVVADAGFTDAGYRAEVEGGEFADGVAVADNQLGRLVAVFFVLRDFAEAGKLENAVVFSDGGVPVDDGMRADFGVRTDLDVGTDDGVRADFDAGVEFGFGVNDGGRVDEGHVFNTPLLVKTNNRKLQFVDFIADRNHLIAKMAKY